MPAPAALLALAVLAPLLLALVPAWSGWRGGAYRGRWLPLASLPALALGLLPEGAALQLPGLLLGVRVQVDGLSRALLLLVGLAWSAAAWFASDRLAERLRSFSILWLLTLAGLVLAAVAGDLASFYAGYVAMTLGAYGLIVHGRDTAALRAGRVYLVMALAGEAMLLAGLLWIGARLGNAELAGLPQALAGADARVPGALLLAGFAVKMGIVPLHPWLPVAHPVAPVPASAILSAVLVKAGLLGALRLVPEGLLASGSVPAGVAALTALGLFTAFYGVAAGLCQTRLKTVLAYSTVSQMGLIFGALALSLAPGGERAAPLLALLLLHHGLNKAALFLAAGSAPGASRLRLVLLALPALSLAGMPLASGDLAKGALKAAQAGAGLPQAGLFALLLSLSSLATALLMLRVFALARRDAVAKAPVHPAWPLLVAAGAVVPWWHAAAHGLAKLPDAAGLWAAAWPLLAAGALAWAWQRAGSRLPALPEGDLLVPVEAAFGALRCLGGWIAALRPAKAQAAGEAPPVPRWRRLETRLRELEGGLAALPAAGALLLLLAGALWGLLG